MSRKGIWDTLNGHINELRQSGMTLQQVGDRIGVTRERVRQILEKEYGTTEMSGFITQRELAKQLGCSRELLARRMKEGVLNPIRTTKLHLYSKEEVENAKQLIGGVCRYCGNPKPTKNPVYCEGCSVRRRQYGYLFWSDGFKEKHKQRCREWRKQNPERWKEICVRASRAWQKKKQLATNYQVTYRNSVLPLGTVFKATGYEPGYIVHESGVKVPTPHLKKV